jgi:hypothetical protein
MKTKEQVQAEKNEVEGYLKMWKACKGNRANWDEHWRDVARYVIPNKENVWDFNSRSKGDKKNLRLYDSSARHYNELLASALHSMLTNPSVQWFELTTGNRELDKNPAVRDYLQDTVRKIHQILNNSNFQTEIHEVYLDLGSFGTGAMLIDEDDDNIINFQSRPIYQFHLMENFKSEVDTFFIELSLTGRQILQKYGEEMLTKEAIKMMKDKPEKEHVVVMMVTPNGEREFGRKDSTNKPFKSVHILQKPGMIVKRSGFDEFPAVFPRWIKDSMETYGRSPSMKALPDIKLINAMMKTIIRSAQKIVDPPLMIPDDGFMRFNTKPGGLNPYRAGTQDKVYPIETRGQVGLGIDMVRDIRDRIKESYYIDQLQLREGPQMTATEVNARTDEHLRLLGPILGRLHFELLQPLIARTIGILKRKKQLPPNPPKELEGAQMQVFYSSQIARAQRISEAQNFERYFTTVLGMAEIMPEVVDNFNPDDVVKYLADIHGAPQEVMREEDARDGMRQQRAEQQQQQEQAMMEQEQAKTAEIATKASNNA